MSQVKVIDLRDFSKSSALATRQVARDLFAEISQTPESVVSLNFAAIEFASRSFFDEFNSYEDKFNLLGKEVQLVNMNDDLRELLEIVTDSVDSTSSQPFSSVSNVKTSTI